MKIFVIYCVNREQLKDIPSFTIPSIELSHKNPKALILPKGCSQVFLNSIRIDEGNENIELLIDKSNIDESKPTPILLKKGHNSVIEINKSISFEDCPALILKVESDNQFKVQIAFKYPLL